MDESDVKLWGLEKLRTKRDQEYELAELARHDGDVEDERRHKLKAQAYSAEIAYRMRQRPLFQKVSHPKN